MGGTGKRQNNRINDHAQKWQVCAQAMANIPFIMLESFDTDC